MVMVLEILLISLFSEIEMLADLLMVV